MAACSTAVAGLPSGERTHASASVPVLGLDVHLQPVSAGGSVPTFLTHKELFSSMLKSLVQL